MNASQISKHVPRCCNCWRLLAANRTVVSLRLEKGPSAYIAGYTSAVKSLPSSSPLSFAMKQQSISRFFGSQAPAKASRKSGAGEGGKQGEEVCEAKGGKKRVSQVEGDGEAAAATPPRKRLRKVKKSKDETPKKEGSSLSDVELQDTPFRSKQSVGATSAGQTPGDVAEDAVSSASESISEAGSTEKDGKKKKKKKGKTKRKKENEGVEMSSESEAGSDVSVKKKSPKGKASGTLSSPPPLKKQKKTTKVEGVGDKSQAAADTYKNFDSVASASWKPGESVPYNFLADTFESIGQTTKRLEITKLLADCFRTIVAQTPGDVLPAVYMCVNCVAPAHEGLELGIGDSLLIKAVAKALGKTDAAVKKLYEKSGDLGKVAVSSRSAQKTLFKSNILTVRSVFDTFKKVAQSHGDKSVDRKRDMIVKLLVASKTNEAGYIIRSLQGKLRIGLAEQTVLTSLAHAIHLEKDSKAKDSELANSLEVAQQAVKKAFSVCPSYDELVPVLLEHGTGNLGAQIGFTPGVPVRPMLAKPTNGITEVLDKFSDVEFTCEYKYDGERAQIHILEDGTVQMYSRSAENTTGRFPDVVERIRGQLKEGVKSAVLDAEAVAYDEEMGILPFQVLSTRGRKDVAVEDIKVQVCIFCFDCLYLNGETLLEKDLEKRRAALYSALEPEKGKLEFATAEISKDVEELQAFLDKSVENKTEGLIVKTMDATYEPSKRSLNWLKLKKDYLKGVGDTFDVVPIGAWYGKGKRTGTFGSYLLAIYNPDAEEYQTISKIGTGFKDEELVTLSEELRKHEIDGPKMYYSYGETLTPEVWFDAKVVWEIKAADLSISPVHQAAKGLVDPSKGISIRFPRLLRVRDDKTPEEATSAEQVATMYNEQPLLKAATADKETED